MSVFLNEGILFQSLADRNRANHCDYATTLVHGTSLVAHVPKWPRPRGFVVTITRGGGGREDIGAKDRRYTPAGENTARVSGAWSRRGKKAPRVHREVAPVCRIAELSDRERDRIAIRSTGVPANYDAVINKDYRSSRNARWKRERLRRFQRSGRAVSRYLRRLVRSDGR